MLQPDTLAVDKSAINITDKYGDDYVFNPMTSSEIPDAIDNGGVIKVCYDLDVIGNNPDPNDPGIDYSDGIPDRYQVVFTYVSADPNVGIIEGTVEEVVTRYDEAGNWSETAAVHPVAAGTTPAPSSGYKFLCWYADGNSENSYATIEDVRAASFSQNTKFVAQFPNLDDLKYTVNYIYRNRAGEVDGTDTTINTGVLGAQIPYETDGARLVYQGNTYLLDHVEGADKVISADTDANVVNVYFDIDSIGTDPNDPDKGDDVPDKYQAVVIYNVENGTVDVHKAVVTLFGEYGVIPAANGTGYLAASQIANATVDAGYNQATESWDGNGMDGKPTTATAITGDTTYNITFDKNIYTITVDVVNGTASTEATFPVRYGDDTESIVFTPNEGYALDTVMVDGAPAELTNSSYVFTNVAANHRIAVVYAEDRIGNNPDPNDPSIDYSDGIPDKYQLTVTYEAVNGVIVGKSKVVLNKYDADGNFAEDGVATIGKQEFIPQAYPVAGFYLPEGTTPWSPETPGVETRLIEDTLYQAIFTPVSLGSDELPGSQGPQGQQGNGNTGGNTGGNAGVQPRLLTQAVGGAATIAANPVPFEAIDDDENPLANIWDRDFDCWVHRLMFIGILVTLIYGVGVILRRRVDIRELDKTQNGPKDQDMQGVPARTLRTNEI